MIWIEREKPPRKDFRLWIGIAGFHISKKEFVRLRAQMNRFKIPRNSRKRKR